MEYKYEFEEWRDVPEYFGLYKVSNWGRVKSLVDNHGNKREKILKPSKDKDGYLRLTLCKDGEKKLFIVHRLVAMAFIPNPDNLPQVNHKNEIKDDNRVSNLEFCDCKYNNNYGTGNERRSKALKGIDFTNERKKNIQEALPKKPVAQYTKDGTLVGIYPSSHEAERQGFNHGAVGQCCRGKMKTYKGFIWKFA